MKRTKILASLTIAQAILESGWGTSALCRKSNNLFGIKGKGESYKTFEYINGKRVDIVDSFKVYPDWETSVADHSNLFLRLSRYQNLIGERDYKTACRKVQEDGYATAPTYSQVLINIIESYKLYRYDDFSEQKFIIIATSDEIGENEANDILVKLTAMGFRKTEKREV